MKLNQGTYFWATFLIFVSLISFSYAKEPTTPPIGQVVWVSGEVKAIMEDRSIRQLARRSAIYVKDTIITNASSMAEMTFTDGSVVSLTTNTTYKIDRYHYEPNGPPDRNEYVVNLIAGGFRTLTGFISKNRPQDYHVNTPVATLGVRGTDYAIYYDEGSGALSAQLNEGAISISNSEGTIELNQATNQLYAVVGGVNQPPTIVPQQPSIFKTNGLGSDGLGGGGSPSLINAIGGEKEQAKPKIAPGSWQWYLKCLPQRLRTISIFD